MKIHITTDETNLVQLKTSQKFMSITERLKFQREKCKQFKFLLKERLYNSLSQAIYVIFNTPHLILKLFLFVSVIGSSGLAAFLVIQSIINFFSHEVITNSRTLFETPTLFPKVTICNLNMFTTEYSFNFLQEINSSYNIYKYYDQLKNVSFIQRFLIKSNFFFLAQGILNGNNFNQDDRKLLAHNLSDILFNCNFNANPCNASDFVEKFDPWYGNCYEFNGGRDLKKIITPGWFNGLQLEVYVNFYEKLNAINSLWGGLGALIRIDNSSYLVDHDLNGITIQSGLQTNIIVDRSFKFMLAKPYSTCEVDSNSVKDDFNSDLFNLIAQSQYQYSQQLCFIQCYQRELVRVCNNTDSAFLSLYNVPPALSNEQIECVFGVYADKYQTETFLEQICLPLCPLECNKTEYKVTLTTSYLLGDDYVDYIKNNKQLLNDFVNRTLDTEVAAKSLIKVNIFYDTLSYTLTTETPKVDIVSLLASIGGNLGLFLGVSVFSLFELVDVFIQVYFIYKEK